MRARRRGSTRTATIVLLEDQDRGLWNRDMIAEGLALIDKAMRHRGPGPTRCRPPSPRCMRARRGRRTPTGRRSICSTRRWSGCSPRRSSRSTARSRSSKVRGPAAALAMIEPLATRLSGYFYFFGVKGALLMQLGRAEEARVAFDRAIALANTAAEAAHIRMHLDRLIKTAHPAGRPGLRASRQKKSSCAVGMAPARSSLG